MKQYYVASLCHEGVLGGGIVADDDGITYKTGKVTVASKLKNLEMKYRNIQDFSQKWVFCFPVFTISMNDGENYKFIIFSPKRFNALLKEKVKH
ncbi:MAG: hypothetical protein Q4D24_05315 [Erysipelotrichaceae bacterium]|nr:hypothetical protein [Erysipelotrichaceae bacterium]